MMKDERIPELGQSTYLRRFRCYGKHDEPCIIEVLSDGSTEAIFEAGWRRMRLSDEIPEVYLCPKHADAVRIALGLGVAPNPPHGKPGHKCEGGLPGEIHPL